MKANQQLPTTERATERKENRKKKKKHFSSSKNMNALKARMAI